MYRVFFDGKLPDFNFGSADGTSCDNALLKSIQRINFNPYNCVYNERFKGGYITRAYGDPKKITFMLFNLNYRKIPIWMKPMATIMKLKLRK